MERRHKRQTLRGRPTIHIISFSYDTNTNIAFYFWLPHPISAIPDRPPVVDTAFGQVEVTHLSLNDHSIEGLVCLDRPVFSVQYHPEASPGPHDSAYLFTEFIQLMEKQHA